MNDTGYNLVNWKRMSSNNEEICDEDLLRKKLKEMNRQKKSNVSVLEDNG